MYMCIAMRQILVFEQEAHGTIFDTVQFVSIIYRLRDNLLSTNSR